MEKSVMRKICTLALSLLLAGGISAAMAPAGFAKAAAPAPMHLEESRSETQDVAAINQMLQDLLASSNRHDIEGVLKHYSPEFISGDGLNLKDIRNLVLETWEMFPDIRYNSRVLEIRTSGKWATVETLDGAAAMAKVDPAVSDTPGRLTSSSRGMLYLQKAGKTWEIISDYILHERAVVTYGPVENVNVDVATPEQVFAGESYSAKLDVDVPPGNIAFAMIAKEPLVYPQITGKNKFRTLSAEKTVLERIFSANDSNNNEVVTATIGFTQIGQDDQERPTINLAGIMTIIKRVNVIPLSSYEETARLNKVVRQSADGKITVEQAGTDEEDAEESEVSGGPEMDEPDFEAEPNE